MLFQIELLIQKYQVVYQKGARKLSQSKTKKSVSKVFRQIDTRNIFWSKIKQKSTPWAVFVVPTAGFMTNVAVEFKWPLELS